MKKDIFSNPELADALKRMAKVSKYGPDPYRRIGDSRHMIITRNKSDVEGKQSVLSSGKKT